MGRFLAWRNAALTAAIALAGGALLLGIAMGASFTPDLVSRLADWPASFAVLAVSTPAVVVATAYFLRRTGWDAATAFFSAIPGALPYVVAIALESRADVPRVAVAQVLRLTALVALVPPAFVMLSGLSIPVQPLAAHETGPTGLALVIAAAAGLGYTLRALKVPAALLIGGMAASAALHLAGIVSGRLPAPWQAAALIIIGAYIGINFRNADRAALARSVLPSLGALAVAVAVASAFALGVARVLGLPFAQTFLAFAPGGIEAMIVLSLVLGFDPAYVGAHQAARFVAIAALLPIVARRFMLAPHDTVDDMSRRP